MAVRKYLMGFLSAFVYSVLLVAMLFMACNDDIPVLPGEPPENVQMVLNEGAEATRDTLICLKISGENISQMKLSNLPDLSDAEWEGFDSLHYYNVPKEDGLFKVFGIFESEAGIKTHILSSEIVLDYTAEILTFEIVTYSDTLEPGDLVPIAIDAGENGRSEISLGEYIKSFNVDYDEFTKMFRDTLIVPELVFEGRAQFTARFTDNVGNVAESVVHSDTLVLSGSTLNPSVISRLSFQGRSNDYVKYISGYCYVTDEGRFHVIDVRRKNRPLYRYPIRTPGWAHGIVSNDSLMLIADHTGLMLLYNVLNPAVPMRIGQARVSSVARDVAMTDYAGLVASKLKGLYLFDLTATQSPFQYARVAINCTGETVCVSDDIAYVAGDGGVAIIDISIPDSPEILSQIDYTASPETMNLPGAISSLYFRDNLFLAVGPHGLVRIDVSDPHNPDIVDIHDHLDNARGLALIYPYLAVSRGTVISIVNISNLETLPVVGQIHDIRNSRQITVDGRYLYVSEENGISIVDLAN